MNWLIENNIIYPDDWVNNIFIISYISAFFIIWLNTIFYTNCIKGGDRSFFLLTIVLSLIPFFNLFVAIFYFSVLFHNMFNRTN